MQLHILPRSGLNSRSGNKTINNLNECLLFNSYDANLFITLIK